MENIKYSGKNMYVVDKKPQKFTSILFSGDRMTIDKEDGEKVGGIDFKKVYACLYCDKIKNITLIEQDKQPVSASMIFKDGEEYEKTLNFLENMFGNIKFSPQDVKINSYAKNIVEKLKYGTELQIIDAIKEKDVFR